MINPVHHAEEAAAVTARAARRGQTMSQLDTLSQMLDIGGEAAVGAAGGVTSKELAEKANQQPVIVSVRPAQN